MQYRGHCTNFFRYKNIYGFVCMHFSFCSLGNNDGVAMISNIKIREEQRMATTSPWMVPFDKHWPQDHVFISTPTYNYTHQDYERLFKDIDYEDGW